MGMFDYVNYEANYERCGSKLSNFQSKDNECILETLDVSEVDNFHTLCHECDTWHDFKVHRKCIVTQIDVTTNNTVGKREIKYG